MSIIILPDFLVDQINAGEVIESPVSVVKELVENSLDAHAENIHVEIHGGGLLSILVHDDGQGMDPIDAKRCFLRHATSKLRTEKDLWSLSTLGFRGEALSSIAACSKMRIQTVQKGKEAGFCIALEGGEVVLEGPCAIRQGTKIEVRSLFYNVPARLKFQKSATSFVRHIMHFMQSQALLYQDKGFVLKVQDKVVLDVKLIKDLSLQESYFRRAKEVLLEKCFDPLIWVDAQSEDFHCKGVIADPSYAGKTRTGQFLCVNNRAVFSPTINRAVLEGYGTRLADRHHPVFILHIEVPKHRVDVNVHPQKKEVRLENPHAWFIKIREAIDSALSHQKTPDFLMQADTFKAAYKKLSSVTWEEPKQQELEVELFPKQPLQVDKPLEPFGLVGYYLLVSESSSELTKKMCLVDLKGAYARCLYEAFLEKKSSRTSQALLFPISIELSAKHSEKATIHLNELQSIGIDIHRIGENTFCIEALPSFLSGEDFSQFFEELLEDLTDTHFSHTVEKKEQKKWTRSAVMIAKKYKTSWSPSEAKQVYRSVLECKDSQYDPLGQRIFLPLTLEHLQRCFEGVEV